MVKVAHATSVLQACFTRCHRIAHRPSQAWRTGKPRDNRARRRLTDCGSAFAVGSATLAGFINRRRPFQWLVAYHPVGNSAEHAIAARTQPASASRDQTLKIADDDVHRAVGCPVLMRSPKVRVNARGMPLASISRLFLTGLSIRRRAAQKPRHR